MDEQIMRDRSRFRLVQLLTKMRLKLQCVRSDPDEDPGLRHRNYIWHRYFEVAKANHATASRSSRLMGGR